MVIEMCKFIKKFVWKGLIIDRWLNTSILQIKMYVFHKNNPISNSRTKKPVENALDSNNFSLMPIFDNVDTFLTSWDYNLSF